MQTKGATFETWYSTSPKHIVRHDQRQYFFFSRNIGRVALPIIYSNKLLSGSKHPKNCLCTFENKSTDQRHWFFYLTCWSVCHREWSFSSAALFSTRCLYLPACGSLHVALELCLGSSDKACSSFLPPSTRPLLRSPAQTSDAAFKLK